MPRCNAGHNVATEHEIELAIGCRKLLDRVDGDAGDDRLKWIRAPE